MATKLLQTFDGPAGSKPDPSIWKLADDAFGLQTGEMQAYAPSQVYLDGAGRCVFRMVDKGFNISPYPQARYLSGRMATRNLFSLLRGRVTVRGFYPPGQMIYSSLCWLGAYDWDYGPFPACGEQDINEYYPDEQGRPAIRTTLIGNTGVIGTKTHYLTASGNVSHEMIYDWGMDKVEWTLNGQKVYSITKAECGSRWAFDHPFFIVVNHGIRGSGQQAFPNEMILEHLQVEDAPIVIPVPDPIPQPVPQPGGTKMDGSQYSARGSRWTTDGSTIYAQSTAPSDPVWAEYKLDFGMGANSLNVAVDNQGTLPVPAGYRYEIEVRIDGQLSGKMTPAPGEIGMLNLGLINGLHIVRLSWGNDFWSPGVSDANLRIKTVSLVSNSTSPGPISGKEQAIDNLKLLGWTDAAIAAVVNP